ncbi:YicC/YloC family endoribonuclease [Isosphaeraceae bacterium EP7]
MLLSMTGFGEARRQDDRWAVSVEVRSVNNRHLKLNAKLGDRYSALEPDLERLVRETLRRGTVQLTLRVDRPRKTEDYRLNTVALASYRAQLQEVFGQDVSLQGLLQLPGVVEERRSNQDDPHEEWPELAEIVSEALAKLQASRAEEGRSMADELTALGDSIVGRLEVIAARAPLVVEGYQKRLEERVRTLLEGKGATLQPGDLIREVSIFAERADIAEEVVRLRAHLGQFRAVIDEPESAGRKLEFVVQEMGRETNTIGSKANDLEISREVVEIKGALEKIRELIQNVE